MVTDENDALVTLQHKTSLAWGHFWKLKERLRSRETLMKSRLALLLLAVMPELLWAAETWTLSRKLFRAIRFVYGTIVQQMEGRRRLGERRLDWHWRTFRGGMMRAVAMGSSASGQNGDLESMELCWLRRTHPDFKPNASWKHWISHGGGTTEGAGGATVNFTDDMESSEAREPHFDDHWNKSGLEWKTLMKDSPRFDSGLKEFTKLRNMRSDERRSEQT